MKAHSKAKQATDKAAEKASEAANKVGQKVQGNRQEDPGLGEVTLTRFRLSRRGDSPAATTSSLPRRRSGMRRCPDAG